MGMNFKGFMLQPVGPEALGWFKEPITAMEDFRKYRFRINRRRLCGFSFEIRPHPACNHSDFGFCKRLAFYDERLQFYTGGYRLILEHLQ